MKSCQPRGSRLINKTFQAMQESDKPQHSMVFPDIHRAFLDRLSMSVVIVFPQTARTEVQAMFSGALWHRPSATGFLIIGTVSVAFHHAHRKILRASQRLSKRLLLPEEGSRLERVKFCAQVTHTASKLLCRVTSLCPPSSHFWESSLPYKSPCTLQTLPLHFLTLWIKKYIYRLRPMQASLKSKLQSF